MRTPASSSAPAGSGPSVRHRSTKNQPFHNHESGSGPDQIGPLGRKAGLRLPGRFRARTVLRLGLGLGLCAGLLLPGSGALPSANADAADWDVPGGHFFTQTGGGTGKGYLVADDGAAAFWSAFQSLGGVAVVGYPVSRRFMHGGFVTQAMQKAVFQWRPESKSVAFVNVFDDLSGAGKDEFLLSARQTPKATPFDDGGRPFEEVVRIRQGVLADP